MTEEDQDRYNDAVERAVAPHNYIAFILETPPAGHGVTAYTITKTGMKDSELVDFLHAMAYRVERQMMKKGAAQGE